eukprot:jgi/Mesvir1/16747/Mv15126-RA.1
MENNLVSDSEGSSTREQEAAQKPVWQPNEDAKECNNCDRPFTLIYRRHHCRSCGRIFCQACSSKKMELPAAFEYTSPQRVCDNCFQYRLEISLEQQNHNWKNERPDFGAVHKTLMDDVAKVLTAEESEWLLKHDHSGVKISIRRVKKSPVLSMRTVFDISAPPWHVVKQYTDLESWKKWNTDMICRVIEDLGDDAQVMSVHYNIPVVDDRDTVFYTIKRAGLPMRPDDKLGHYTAATSVEHPLCPRVEGVVRAQLHLSCTMFEAADADGTCTRFTAIVHSDPRGLLPPFIINRIITSTNEHLLKMKYHMEETYRQVVAAK